MKVTSEIAALHAAVSPVVMAAGFFDGVHLGHRQILAEAVSLAERLGGEPWVLTFERHPLAVLAPSKAPPLISTQAERLALFESMGIRHVLMLPFTRELAVMEPAAFIAALSDGPQPAIRNTIICGPDWRFGRRAVGTPELLAELGPAYGFSVEVVPFALYRGERISSSRIRDALLSGHVEEAADMLARPYGVKGLVVKGKGIAGRVLGFATANVAPEADVLPQAGVYAVEASVDGDPFRPALANIGSCPTFADLPCPTPLEVHIPGEARILYGHRLHVLFTRRLRDETRFASVDALREQIARDCEALSLPPPSK